MNRRHESENGVTIYDVARLANVSPATVSRVLNDVKVRPDSKKRVLDAIQKLGFRPNRIASALITKRIGTAGLIVPDVRNPFYAEVVREVEVAARNADYSIVICNAFEDAWRQREYVDLLRSKGVDGLIALTTTEVDSYLIELAAQRYPIVLMDRGNRVDERIFSVGTDNFAGASLAMKHVLELGHREILIIAESPHWPGGMERVRGMEQVAQEWGLDRPLQVVFSETSSIAGGVVATRKALALNPQATAAICGNDVLALGAILAVRETGRTIPQDFSVVGFDGTAFARTTVPSLTTISQPIKEMCEVGVDMLLRQIRNGTDKPESHIMKPSLTLGESTGPVPGSA